MPLIARPYKFDHRSSRFMKFLPKINGGPVSRRPKSQATGVDNTTSSKDVVGIFESVIRRLSCYRDISTNTLSYKDSSLQDLLKVGIHFSPDIIRKYWRATTLSPRDFLDVLLGFGSKLNSREVLFLWNLFRWTECQTRGFRHLRRSYQIIILMLVDTQLLEEAECLLFYHDDCDAYSKIIQSYAKSCKLERAMVLYERARDWNISLSSAGYRALLDLLVRLDNTELAQRVYVEMLDVGIVKVSEVRFLDFVVTSLTKNGKIVEAVNILRRARDCFSIKASQNVLTAIAESFCHKKDFEDLLNFSVQWEHIPESHVRNKIVSSLCRNIGSEGAWLFVLSLEPVGFVPDATTFGILITRSCIEGNLKNAFIYISESLSRYVEVEVHSYNAILCGLFKDAMHEHARNVFDDMLENGMVPNLSTYEILLAGFCKCRKFDDCKLVLGEMVNRGLVSVSPVEDTLAKLFLILGLDSLGTKLKRDNNFGHPRAEFFDSLGNGLYLETDLDEYENKLVEILDSKMIPDFEPAIIEKCRQHDANAALELSCKNMECGKILSLPTLSELIKCICASQLLLEEGSSLFNEVLESCNQLDCKVIKLLIRTLSENGKSNSAKRLLSRLLLCSIEVEADSYCSVIMGFSKEKNIGEIQNCLKLAQQVSWSPVLEDIKACVSCLCSLGLVHEVLNLSDSIGRKCPEMVTPVCNALVQEFCLNGFGNAGCLLMEEALNRIIVLDHMAYVYLIKGFLKGQKLSEALGIIDILICKNIDASAEVYQLIMPTLVQHGKLESAMNLMESLLNKQFEDGAFAYGVLIYELGKNGRIKEATHLLLEMLDRRFFPDNKTWNAVVQGYCQVKDLKKAYEVLCMLRRMSADISLSTYRSLVREMCIQGKENHAVKLRELITGNDKSETLILYNILIFSLFQTGKYLIVDDVLNEMQEKQLLLDECTYNFIIYGYYKNGNVTRAAEALTTMVRENMQPSNRSLRVVICYLCDNGKLDEALHLIKMMQGNGCLHSRVVQAALIASCISHSRFSEAESFLDNLELVPGNINYDILIRRFCMHGRIKKAVHLLNVMLKRGNLPSDSSYNAVICRLCFAKEFNQSLDFHAEMQQMNLQPSLDACEMLIECLCISRNTDIARNILGEMIKHDIFPTHAMYKCVLNRYCEGKDMKKASEVLDEMQRNGCSPDFVTHWSLISNLSCYDSKKPEDSKGFLHRLLSGTID